MVTKKTLKVLGESSLVIGLIAGGLALRTIPKVMDGTATENQSFVAGVETVASLDGLYFGLLMLRQSRKTEE